MIRYYYNNEQFPLTKHSDFHIKHCIDGNDEMHFRLATGTEDYKRIGEETQIDYGDNQWLVKKISDEVFDCMLDFDFLKTRAYMNYKSETKPLAYVLEQHLPTGWTVHGANISSISRTIEFEICTDYDVIQKCISVYSVYFIWKIKKKELYVFTQEENVYGSEGEYITKDLNLKSITFKGDSTNFATRLYAYGAEGLTLENATVNGRQYGLKYVDNNQYANKIVCVTWKDERYSNADNLYNAAVKKLAELSVPTRSYECSVIDLAKQNPSFSFLEFKMHYKAILIDSDRGTRIEHRVVEYDEYPDEPSRNVVTLSCTAGTIQSYVNSISTGLTEEVKKQDNSINGRVLAATALLLSAFGTYTFTDANGNTYFADNKVLQSAENVWIINKNGIGHSSTGVNGPYTSAWTSADELVMSVINAMVIRGEYIEAGSIKADQINVDYTDGVLSSAYKIAEGVIENNLGKIENYLHNDDGTGEIDVIKETLVQYKEDIDGWSAAFTDKYTGGINCLLNSAGLNGTTYWSYEHVDGATIYPKTFQGGEAEGCTVSNSAITLYKLNSIKQEVTGLIKGSAYTLSGKLKVLGTGSFSITIGHKDENEEYVEDFELLRTPATPETHEWYEFDVKIPELTRTSIILCFSNVNSEQAMYLSDLMLTEGETHRSWSPAPNEIYTANTKIDKNGVTVENNQSMQKTIMTPTEFAGYFNGAEVFSVNGDETHAKNTFVDGKLIIAKSVGESRKGIVVIPIHEELSRGVNIALLD